MFDFAGWLQVAIPVAALLTPINIAAVQGLGKLGLSGKAQLAGAGVTGLLLGVGASIAFWGLPATFLEWFLAVIFGLVVFGTSVGTYEAAKNASAKGVGIANGE